MKKSSRLVALVATLIAVLGVSGIVWNEARKEVEFLCGNFRPGVTQASVFRQLDTGNFLRIERTARGNDTIIVDSVFNLGWHSCVIEFDENRNVVVARYT